MLDCALADRKFYLPKDGSMKLQFFHVKDFKDLCRLMELIIERIPQDHICQGTGRIPIIEFEKERPFLLHLPNECIRNQYSVPTKFIGKEVQYQLHDSKVYIYADASLIAVHELTDRKLNYTAEHYAEVLSYKYIGKDSDEVRQLAKQKLAKIGGTYT